MLERIIYQWHRYLEACIQESMHQGTSLVGIINTVHMHQVMVWPAIFDNFKKIMSFICT